MIWIVVIIVFVLEFVKWIFLSEGMVFFNIFVKVILCLVGVLYKILFCVVFVIVFVIWGCVCLVMIGLNVVK